MPAIGDGGPGHEGGLEAVRQRDRLRVPAAISSVVVEVAIADSAAMPSAPPTCCDVLISPDARPGLEARTPASAAIEIGTNGKPMPTAITRKPGSRSLDVRAADRDLREVRDAGGEERHAGDEHGLDADAGHQLGRHRRPDDRGAGHRQVRDARPQRRVAEHLLHVERQHQEHREQHGPERQARDVRAGHGAQAEDRERHERIARRASQPTNAASSATAAVKRPIVSGEPQPYSLACVIA